MPWQAIDFMGISLHDDAMVEKFNLFLYERREYLILALLQLFPPLTSMADAVMEEFSATQATPKPFRLFHNVFASEMPSIRQYFEENPSEWEGTIRQLNGLLWEHVELLEGSTKELFLHLSNVGIDQWKENLKSAVTGFHNVLKHHIGDIRTFIEDFENTLTSLHDKLKGQAKGWSFSRLWQGSFKQLDASLLGNLQGCETYLNTQFDRFQIRNNNLSVANKEVDQRAEKLQGYEVLATLGEAPRSTYIKLYRLLKLWQQLSKSKQCPSGAFEKAFYLLPSHSVFNVLKQYYGSLEATLYEKSRSLKTTPRQLFAEAHARGFILESMQGIRRELHTLGSLIIRYREYLLLNDPNPYVRSRWGFRESTTGPLPSYSARLTDLGFDVEYLDDQYGKLIHSFEKGPQERDEENLYELDLEIQRSLHALGQPLVPESFFRNKAEKVLELVESLDELGAFGRDVVDYVRQVLSRLLRADWKGHLLHDIPLFEKLYKQHQGIIGDSVDKAHTRRLEKFSLLQERVFEHVRQAGVNDTAEGEFIYDINDLKGYLQDFLATIQRSLQDDAMGTRRARRHIEEAAQQLLEYRYSFGLFFHRMLHLPQGKMLRTQFYFVDQYFETIENKIYEFRIQKGLIEEEGPSSEEASSL